MTQTQVDKGVSGAFVRYFSSIHYRLRWMPWQQSLAIALLSISLVFAAGVVVPTFNHVSQLKQETQHLRVAIPQHQGHWTPQSPEASISTFYQFLPTKNTINQTLYTLHQAIAAQGLITERIEYRLLANPTSAFQRYQIIFPIKGDYQKIRLCINELLNTFPTLALSEFSLRRNDAQTQEVEAHVKLTMFLRSNG